MEIAIETSVRGWEIPRTHMRVYGVANVNGIITGEHFFRHNTGEVTLYDPNWKGSYRVASSSRTHTIWDGEYDIRNYSSRDSYPPLSGVLNLAEGMGVICLIYPKIVDRKGNPRFFESQINKSNDDPAEMAVRQAIQPPRFEWDPQDKRVYLIGGTLPFELAVRPSTPDNLPLPYQRFLLNEQGIFLSYTR